MDKRIKIAHDFLTKTECESLLNDYFKNVNSDYTFLKKRIFDYLNLTLKGYELDLSEFKIYKLDKTSTNPDWHIDTDSYISIMIQLNDDYVDGIFQFLLDEGDTYFQLHHGSGKMVSYFSNIKNRTTPIIRGDKYVLTTSIKIQKIIDYKKTII